MGFDMQPCHRVQDEADAQKKYRQNFQGRSQYGQRHMGHITGSQVIRNGKPARHHAKDKRYGTQQREEHQGCDVLYPHGLFQAIFKSQIGGLPDGKTSPAGYGVLHQEAMLVPSLTASDEGGTDGTRK